MPSDGSGHGIAKKINGEYTGMKRESSMSTIMPHSELVRKAATYLAERRAQEPGKSLAGLLDEAGMRFNLTPLDAASLERLFRKEETKPD